MLNSAAHGPVKPNNNMVLNPAKCVFGVAAGKFLGFMLSQRGIEANPKKIKALIDMAEPTSIKEVQRLNGRVAALGHFISKSAERSLPFFKALRGAKDFKWTEECSKSFNQLKEYLGSPPLLSSPVAGEDLYVYLSASDKAVAAVMVIEEDGIQRPVYYVSKALSDVETRYFNAEKIAYALVIATRKLRAYFSAHPIVVYTDAPLRKILHRPESSGYLLNWSIELTDFDIQYRTRKTLQAQALADFLIETSFCSDDDQQRPPQKMSKVKQVDDKPEELALPVGCWKIFLDGSGTRDLSGAGIVLVEPESGTVFEEVLRFKFQASNNQAEYEALITAVEYAKCFGATKIVAYCDSQLIVNQVHGDYHVVDSPLCRNITR